MAEAGPHAEPEAGFGQRRVRSREHAVRMHARPGRAPQLTVWDGDVSVRPAVRSASRSTGQSPLPLVPAETPGCDPRGPCRVVPFREASCAAFNALVSSALCSWSVVFLPENTAFVRLSHEYHRSRSCFLFSLAFQIKHIEFFFFN